MSTSRPGSDSNQPSRRSFLKTTGVVAGTALAGNLSIARSAHAAGNDTLKIGLIGCGGRGTGAALNAMDADPNTKLVAMGDLFMEKVQGKLKHLQKAKPKQVAVDADHCFAGYDAYKQVIDSDVDVVVLGEVPHYRPIHLKAAIDAGKHVFCEKPVAVDAPGIRSVLDTAKKARDKGLSIVSGLCWRYNPAIQETMKRIQEGALGDIMSLHVAYLFGLVGRPTAKTPGMSEMEYQARNWWYFTWLSGDHNVEQQVHSLDKGLWVMGDTPPIAAWGSGGRQIPTFNQEKKPGDIYDHHSVVYEYPNGVLMHAYCRQQAGAYRSIVDKFAGTKGSCKIDWDKCAMSDPQGEKMWRYRSKGPKRNMYVLEHEALFKGIRSGNPINNGQYMADSTMMAILGRMVDYTGQRITWEEAMNSKESLVPSEYSFKGVPPTLPDAEGNYKIAMPGITKFV